MHIRARGIRKRFQDRTILDGVNLFVESGKTLVLLGPSGSGKSTLLRCLNGLNTFDEGTVDVGDRSLQAGHSGQFSSHTRDLRKLLGMVFQDFQLFPHLSVLQNIMEAPVTVSGVSKTEARLQALELLKSVGLENHGQHYPSQLSGGQKQRVAIARALAMRPRALLCDEITSSLDPELKHEVLEVLEKLQERGLTLLMVTHEIGFARKAADHIVFMADGKVVEEGKPSSVLDSPVADRTRNFLANILG